MTTGCAQIAAVQVASIQTLHARAIRSATISFEMKPRRVGNVPLHQCGTDR